MGIFDKKQEGGKWDKWIGERIKKAREDKNWTQAQLAEAVSETQPRISDYERGAVEIGVAELGYLALALEMPITAFIAPKFKGATPNDLTDTQKTLINYCNQMSEEMELALLEQAKTYARVSRRVREEKHREEMEALRPQIEADKRKAREIVRRKT